jgi:hypothetical protein
MKLTVTHRYRPTKLVIFISLFILLAFVFSSFAVAQNRSRSRVLPAQKATPSAKIKNKDKNREEHQNRLSEVKLKVCEKRESQIQKRSTKLVARAENIQNRFDRIAQKVDDFYIDKLVPAELEIDNYDLLLNNLENKRRDVAAAVGVAEDTAENFTCEGEDPKDHVKLFKADMKNVISALKDYKKAIINYLVTVRTKAKNYKAETATSSSEPATGSSEPATESADSE